jgi:hypothetical protein
LRSGEVQTAGTDHWATPDQPRVIEHGVVEAFGGILDCHWRSTLRRARDAPSE